MIEQSSNNLKEIPEFELGAAPLKGNHLLQANAGTGKTFALSGLFLKFLYFEESLTIKNLVAITFTKAATQEIFTRIKSDLEKFLEIITSHPSPPKNLDWEKFSFSYLLQDYYSLPPQKKEIKRKHLKKNLLNFDEHNIHTIHGFAGKIITEYRFELGLTIGETITKDDSFFFEESFYSFWRKYILDLDPFFLAFFEVTYPPNKWETILKTFYHQPSLVPYPPSRHKNPIQAWEKIASFLKKNSKYIQQKNQLQKLWDQFCEWLLEQNNAVYIENFLVNLVSLNVLKKNEAKKLIKSWKDLKKCSHKESVIPFLYSFFKNPKLLSPFVIEKFESSFKKNFNFKDYFDHKTQKTFDWIDTLVIELDNLKKDYQEYSFSLIHASIEYVRDQSQQMREQMGVVSFNDLLEILAQHISSSRGDHFTTELSKVFRVLLIDEFQDTDPLQFTIFQNLSKKVQSAYFIADPKQSIYGFRQANIHTYFHARESMNNIYQLSTNYRSTPLLLDGINHLYTRHPSPFSIPQLNYFPSKPGIKPGIPQDEDDGKPIQLQFWESAKSMSADKMRQISAHQVARSIQAQINQGYHPSQIAILVRKRQQGILLDSILRSYGIPSRMDDSDNIFDTQEAHELYLLVKAIVACDSETHKNITTFKDPRLLGALSTSFFQKEKIYQHHPCEDEEMEKYLLQFRKSFQEWQEKGWYVMFHRFMREEHIPSKLLSEQNGIYRYRNLIALTDILHHWEQSSSMVQVSNQTRSYSNPGAILRKFSTCLKEATPLEIDLPMDIVTESVKITTIHKSKGLQYDVVHLPFGDQNLYSSPQEKVIFKMPLSRENNGSTLAYDIGSEQYDVNEKLSRQETLTEELRLLYVALTRAKKKLFLYLNLSNKNYPKSTLRYLLHPPKSDSWEEEKDNNWEEEITMLGKHPALECKSFLYQDFSPLTFEQRSHPLNTTDNSTYPPFVSLQPVAGAVFCEGFITSFSSLTRNIQPSSNISHNLSSKITSKTVHQQDTLVSNPLNGNIKGEVDVTLNGISPGDRRDEQMDDYGNEVLLTENISSPKTLIPTMVDDPLSAFSPGSSVGLFLHEVLEKIDFLNRDENYLKSILAYPGQKYLGEYFRLQSETENIWDKLLKMLLEIQMLKLPFPSNPNGKNQPFSLYEVSSTPNNRIVREMEFSLYFSRYAEKFKKQLFSLLQQENLIEYEKYDENIEDKIDTLTDNQEEIKIIFRNGFMKGFIDMVFCHHGCYYLLDWKSNYLGQENFSYKEDNLHQVMIKENYYLQAYIYTLALDRYLALRLGENYDYQTHFGGFAYIFVRGIKHQGVITRKPSYHTILKLRQLLMPTDKDSN